MYQKCGQWNCIHQLMYSVKAINCALLASLLYALGESGKFECGCMHDYTEYNFVSRHAMETQDMIA